MGVTHLNGWPVPSGSTSFRSFGLPARHLTLTPSCRIILIYIKSIFALMGVLAESFYKEKAGILPRLWFCFSLKDPGGYCSGRSGQGQKNNFSGRASKIYFRPFLIVRVFSCPPLPPQFLRTWIQWKKFFFTLWKALSLRGSGLKTWKIEFNSPGQRGINKEI